MSAHDSIMKGLNEALLFAQGKDVGAKVHHVEVPTVDVAAIRARTGLSQGDFARSIGVAKGTLLNWEHGRRRPTGPPPHPSRPSSDGSRSSRLYCRTNKYVQQI
jgi:putative transcriptional regulator